MSNRLPLTTEQQGLLYECLASDEMNKAYNVVMAFRVAGIQSRRQIERALDSLVRRHRLLAARVSLDDGDLPVFVESHRPMALEIRAGLPADVAATESMVSIELERGPMCRAFLVENDLGAPAALVLSVHHVVCDGISAEVLAGDLLRALEDTPLGLPVVVEPMERRQASLNAVLDRIEGALIESRLPLARKLADPPPVAAGVVRIELGGRDYEALDAIAARFGTSRAGLCLSAWMVVLARWAGGLDHLIAVPVSHRPESQAGEIGFHVGQALIRATLRQGDTVATAVERLTDHFFDAIDDGPVDFPALVRAARLRGIAQDRVRPVVSFGYERREGTVSSVRGSVVLEPMATPARLAKDTLYLEVEDRPRCLGLSLVYAANLIERDTALAMLHAVSELLPRMAEVAESTLSALDLAAVPSPVRVPLANASAPDGTGIDGLVERIARHAALRPQAVAVVDDAGSLTYAQLHAKSNFLAAQLRGAGAGPERLVAVAVPRGSVQVVALLAVLKSGAAFLPIDAEAPSARLEHVLNDARPSVVVIERGQPVKELASLPAVPACCPDDVPPLPDSALPERSAQAIAYCLYTSGSTGEPKAVMISLCALEAHIDACAQRYGLTTADRVLQLSGAVVDPSIEQTFTALWAGACLDVHRGPAPVSELLATFIRDRGVTVADVPLSHWRAWHAKGPAKWPASALRLLIVGGEPIPASAVPSSGWPFRWLAAYGPTEATITVLVDEPAREAHSLSIHVPIGRPLSDERLYVLDERLRPVPPGALGELHIAGARVARGYLRRPGLTATRFLPDPFGSPGARMYCTGDVVRCTFDGRFEFCGRTDDQVKIRGYRIELGEIRAAILRQPGVTDAHVSCQSTSGGEAWLAAHVEGDDLDTGSLARRVGAALPSYAVPSAWKSMPALPRNASGKVHSQALPRIERTDSAVPAGQGRAPATPTELAMAPAWRELLERQELGVDDDFFLLGGHSLIATQIVAYASRTFAVQVPLRTLLDSPTLGGFARRLDELVASAGPQAASPPKLVPRRSAPLP
jgi:amino acid adenylation domain-containing protein